MDKHAPRHVLQHSISKSLLEPWDREVCVWPLVAAGVAATVYTAIDHGVTLLTKEQASLFPRLTAELIGIGGIYISIIVLASCQSHLREMSLNAAPFSGVSKNSSTRAIHCHNSAERFTTPMIVLVSSSVVFAAIHIASQHGDASFSGFSLGVSLLIGNILLLLSIRLHCRSRLLASKAALIQIDIDPQMPTD